MIAPLLLLLSAGPAADGPALAGVEFRPPPSLRAVEARPPALWEGVERDGTAERARMVLFVVPAPFDASRVERVDAALRVAALYARPLADGAPPVDAEDATIHLLEVERSSGLETVRLILARLDGRTAGLVLTGEARVVAGLADEHRAAAASISASTRIHPPSPGAPVGDGRLGCTFRAPVGFEPEGPREDGRPRRLALAPHLGLRAEVELAVLDAYADAPFSRAAAGLREALAAEGETGEAELGRIGPLPAVQIEHASDGRRHLVHLIELHGRRVLLTYAAPAPSYERFRAAFIESAATFAAVERSFGVALGPAVADDEVGFTMRPPLGFDPVGDADDDGRAFEEADRTPPRNRLVVRRTEARLRTDDLDACVAWAAARAADAEGWTPSGEPRALLLNGRRAAHVDLVDARDDTRRQDRWTVASRHGAYELVFTATRDEHDLYRESVQAAVLTFRPAAPRVESGLADAVLGPTADVSFRPPRGWTEVERIPDAVTFAADDPAHGRLRVSVAAAAARSLADAADLARQRVVAEVVAQGGEAVLVESAATRVVGGNPDVLLTVRFQRAGRTVRGTHRVILARGRVVHGAVETADAEPEGRWTREALDSIEVR